MTEAQYKQGIASKEAKVVKNNLETKDTAGADTPKTVVVEEGSLKEKLMAQTNKMGVTQEGKIFKGFLWGLAFGVACVLGYQYAKDKGYLKIK